MSVSSAMMTDDAVNVVTLRHRTTHSLVPRSESSIEHKLFEALYSEAGCLFALIHK